MRSERILFCLALLALNDHVLGHLSMYDSLLGLGSPTSLGMGQRSFGQSSPLSARLREGRLHEALDLLTYMETRRNRQYDIRTNQSPMMSPQRGLGSSRRGLQSLLELLLSVGAGSNAGGGIQASPKISAPGSFQGSQQTAALTPAPRLSLPRAAIDTQMLSSHTLQSKACGASKLSTVNQTSLFLRGSEAYRESTFTCRCRAPAFGSEAQIDNSLQARLDCRTEISGLSCCLVN